MSYYALESASAADSKFKLTFATFFPEKVSASQFNVWWMKEIEKRTAGRVTFTPYWAQSLVKARDLATATGKGVCDVSLLATGYTRAAFPITGTYEAVYITDKPDAACRAFTELFDKYTALRDEWKANNLKLMFFDMLGSNIFGFSKKVDTLEAIRGLKIRTSGRMTEVVKALDASPISLPSPEIYEAIDRRLLDGYTNTSLSSAVPRSLHEVAKYTLDARMGVYALIETAMNLDTWNKLPPDIQNVIREVSSEAIDKSVEILMAVEDESMVKMAGTGAVIYTLSPDEAEKWKEKVIPIYDTYIAELEAKNLPGQKIWNDYKALVKKYEKSSTYVGVYDRWVKKYGK
jgi:TRAP-type C4-dicarboxylate transport system substrate-binding protein